MSYIGNTPTQQNFVAGADQFSGNGSTTAFTLSRNVNTVFDIFVAISNVPQDPYSAYSVSGNTLTFTSAPPSGTGNIYVVYRATNVQTFVPTPGVSASFGDVTYTGTLTGSTGVVNIGSGQVYKDSSGNVGIGTSSPTYQTQIYGTGQTTAALTDAGNKGGSLLLNTPTVSAGDGGALLIGAGGSGAKPFAAIKGLLSDGGGNTTGSLAFSTRNATGDTALTERARIDTSGNFILTAAGNINLNIFNTQSLAQSGYQKFPNGLIIQWGRATLGGTSVALSFPITFPNAFWGIAGIPKYGSAISIAFNGESTSGLTLRTSINTGDYFPYIAVGY